MLRALNQLHDTGLSRDRLCEIGLKLGADVPYCLRGGTMLAEGIGEKLTQLADMPHCYVVLCKPPFAVSTREVYQEIDSVPLTQRPDTEGMKQALENGDYQGYDVYFARRLGQDLGVELKLVSVDAPNRVEYLTSAKVDIILANFTVTPARAEVVDFALPYMKVALGVVSPDSALITTAEQLAGKTLIVSKGTTAETYFAENHPEVRLLKFDTYTEAFNALLDGRGDALSTDNTEVLAWALENPGFTVGIESLGSLDTIAPAVQKGNDTVRAYIDEEIKALAAESFFHADFDATLKDVYGEAVNPDSLVVEGGVIE